MPTSEKIMNEKLDAQFRAIGRFALDDLLDRKGFRQTWDETDDDTREDILQAAGRAAYAYMADISKPEVK